MFSSAAPHCKYITLFNNTRTSALWLVTPIFENIDRRWARAVFLHIWSSSAASSKHRPFANSDATADSASVKLNRRRAISCEHTAR